MFKSITKNYGDIQKKSFNSSLITFLLSNDFQSVSGQISPAKAFRYYRRSAPLFTGIKLVMDNLKMIEFVLKDTKKDEFVTEHDILSLLLKPSPFMGGDLFLEAIASFFLLTGDAYVEIISNDNRPIELDALSPQFISTKSDFTDGRIGQYVYQPTGGQSITYKRDDNFRFFATNGNELINLKSFNPSFTVNNHRGTSVVQAIDLEIQQYLQAAIHNNSLLKNGARPSGVLTYKGKDNLLEPEQIDLIKESLKSTMTGSENAGKMAFLTADFDWLQLSESIKDMDFAQLNQRTSIAIYNNLKIPLPMISPDHMALANMETSKLNFYDNAIIPLFTIISSFFNKHLLPRYANSDNLVLTFDEAEIAALEPRRTENTKNLSQSGVLTINEVRSKLGYEDIEGGNQLYQPQTLIPIGTDRFIDDNRDKPARKIYEQEKQNYIRILQGQKGINGMSLFSTEDIDSLVSEHYAH